MIIDFKIKRATLPGERVYIVGASPLVGAYVAEKGFELHPEEANRETKETEEVATTTAKEAEGVTATETGTKAVEQVWCGRLKVDPIKERIFRYKYFTKNREGKLTFEAGGGRRLALNSATQHIITLDEWQENDNNAPFLTDPFAHVFYGTNYSPYTQTHRRQHEVIIRAVVPNVPKDCHLILIGNTSELGSWHISKGVKMARLKGLKWIASIDCSRFAGRVWEYSFAIVNDNTGETKFEKRLEQKFTLTIPELSKHQTLIVEHSNICFNFIPPRFAGVSISLAALKSEQSCGIGEISDLKLLVDWANASGMKVINILPVNDTTRYFNSKDSSPYNAISSVAINPIYLSMSAMPQLKNERAAKEAEEERRSLNRRSKIDYEDIYAFKNKYFRAVYNENEDELTSHPKYYKFIKENKEWVYSYALFCSLRDYYKTANFERWGNFAKYSQPLVDKISSDIFDSGLNQTYNIDMKPIHSSVRYYVYLQFILYNQMKEVIQYAHNKGIAIAGELPMNVSPESVDAWKLPHLFCFQGSCTNGKKDNLAKINSIIKSSQTGASAPVYNWEAMKQDNYEWWILRVRAIHSIYDVISLGRIGEQAGLTDNHELVKMLPKLVTASNMLVCGKFTSSERDNNCNDDLAVESDIIMKSESIRKCMEDLHVLSLELPMGRVETSNYYSITSTSTCHSRTLRMWLGEKLKTLAFTSEEDGGTFYDATVEDCKAQIKNVLETQSMFALMPIQDWMSIDNRIRNRFQYSERVNNPQVSGWVWNYRMHISLEKLLTYTSLSEDILNLITESGRK